MAPKRADYRSRKEYRWAKKVEQREYIQNAPPLPATLILDFCVWFIAFAAVAGIFSPGVAFPVSIVATVLFHMGPRKPLAEKWDASSKAAHEKRVGPPPVARPARPSAKAPVTVTSEADVSSTDPTNQIRKLAELRDEGAITDEEFAAKKEDLLGRI
jgi:hypothetical protein